MDEIGEELHWGVDEYCYTILAGRIRLLLDYASRFYRRQFILRHNENQEMLERTDRELEIFSRPERHSTNDSRHRKISPDCSVVRRIISTTC